MVAGRGDWFNLFERIKRHQLYYQGPLVSRPNVRPWSLHRNGHLGIARWGGWVWSGDTQSAWKTLEAQVAVGINHSLSVGPYWGSDTGGFYTTSELTPYTYTLAAEARETGMPLMRAMWLHYPRDENVRGMGTQYLWGRDTLVAPLRRPAGGGGVLAPASLNGLGPAVCQGARGSGGRRSQGTDDAGLRPTIRGVAPRPPRQALHVLARTQPYRMWSGSIASATYVSFIFDMLSPRNCPNSSRVFSFPGIRAS